MRFRSGGSNVLLLSRSFEKWSIKAKLLNGTTGSMFKGQCSVPFDIKCNVANTKRVLITEGSSSRLFPRNGPEFEHAVAAVANSASKNESRRWRTGERREEDRRGGNSERESIRRGVQGRVRS